MSRVQASAHVFCVVLSLLLVLTGCKKEPSSESGSQPQSVAQTSTVKKGIEGPELMQAGQPVEYENLQITLLSLKRVSEFTKTPDEGQGYAVLRFRVKNIGQEEESARISGDLQWRDQVSGYREGTESYTGVKLNNPKEYNLAPGEQGEYEDVYMFPLNLTNAEFHYLDGYDPKEKARWDMPIE